MQSLSARRAWIETIDYIIDYVNDAVALRKESVDRNARLLMYFWPCGLSLSARRAWIETIALFDFPVVPVVALRKESVDRNVPGQNLINSIGLSLSARRAWIETRLSCTDSVPH